MAVVNAAILSQSVPGAQLTLAQLHNSLDRHLTDSPDTICLVRDGVMHLFPRELFAFSADLKNLQLRHGDQLLSFPFNQSVFYQMRAPRGGTTYLVMGRLASQEEMVARPRPQGISNFEGTWHQSTTAKAPFAQLVNMIVLQRVTDAQVCRLYLPYLYSIEFGDGRDARHPGLSSALWSDFKTGVYLLPGDVVEITRLDWALGDLANGAPALRQANKHDISEQSADDTSSNCLPPILHQQQTQTNEL